MNRTLSAILLATSLSSAIHAATFGNFTYTDNGGTITIDDFNRMTKGDIVVPATINGKPVTEIGPSAFFACRRITSITLPEFVTRIGKAAFSVCDKMQSVNIPAGVTAIEDETFYSCRALEQLDLPAGITHIGQSAFLSCSGLKSFVLPPLVTTFSQSMLGSCTSLTNITIPPRVTRIEDGALAGTGVKFLIIPETVQHLGSRQFYGSHSLKQVEIRCQTREIGENMFAYCESLENVELPKSVRVIGETAFWNCSHLTTVRIPKAVVRIEKKAFLGCQRLEGARFEGDAPEMGERVFKDTASNFKIFIEENRKGFTFPRWLGYRLSKPRAEILIQNSAADSLVNGNVSPMRFASVIVGKKSRAQSFVITNVGNRPITGIGTSFKGEGFLEYVIVKAPVTTLEPGESTVIKVVFEPLARGKRTVSLQVSSSDADESSFAIPLTGIGIEEL